LGKSLHRALVGYRIDKDLVGRDTPLGPVPSTLWPIFRDHEGLSGSHTLTDTIIAALEASASLLVLCSTFTATRAAVAVNEVVRLFGARHPDRPVFPVTIEGTPPFTFPRALRYEIATDGTITDRPVTLFGPDLHISGAGKNIGLAKVVASLIGMGTDEVTHDEPIDVVPENWTGG
jgi:hypothetical protein